uniref:MADF domain-containing protein n=1 Tax=Steinernema glaseri TaxID=37863 RepID=A0A1I7ZME5_9BILA
MQIKNEAGRLDASRNLDRALNDLLIKVCIGIADKVPLTFDKSAVKSRKNEIKRQILFKNATGAIRPKDPSYGSRRKVSWQNVMDRLKNVAVLRGGAVDMSASGS